MKITKYPQSCILIETNNKNILIDPGYLKFENEFYNNWKNIDLLLVTHKHRDHIDTEIINKIISISPNINFYTSQEVASAHPSLNPIIVKEGELINYEQLKIEVVKAVHGFIPTLIDDKAINENIGFIIDDQNKRLYFTSDSICFQNEYKADILVVPVSNHGITTGPYDAALFAKQVEAKTAIPVHYDNPAHPVNIEELKSEFKKNKIELVTLNIKESVNIS